MRHSGTRLGVVLSLTVAFGLVVATSAAAAGTKVSMQNEAWYETSPADDPDEGDPTCTLPTGCAPPPNSPAGAAFPADTLQVAISGGRETARTFLALDKSGLPKGKVATGGTLTMPILTDQASGSVVPEQAKLRACAVPGFVADERGGPPKSQPKFSCETSSDGKYDEKTKSFTFDLTPIAATLLSGGIAILPTKAARDAAETFRVAFPAKEHQSKPEISATIVLADPATVSGGGGDFDLFDEPAGGGTGAGSDPAPAFEDSGAAGFDSSTGTDFGGSGDVAAPPVSDSLSAPPPVSTGPLAGAAGQAPAPKAAASAAGTVAAPAAALLPTGFSYPAVWLAPIIVAALAAALAQSLATELAPVRRTPVAGIAGMSVPPGTDPAAGLAERLRDTIWPPSANSATGAWERGR